MKVRKKKYNHSLYYKIMVYIDLKLIHTKIRKILLIYVYKLYINLNH